jgi:hypothetical protein
MAIIAGVIHSASSACWQRKLTLAHECDRDARARAGAKEVVKALALATRATQHAAKLKRTMVSKRVRSESETSGLRATVGQTRFRLQLAVSAPLVV